MAISLLVQETALADVRGILRELQYHADCHAKGTDDASLWYSLTALQLPFWRARLQAILADANLTQAIAQMNPALTSTRLQALAAKLDGLHAALQAVFAGAHDQGCWSEIEHHRIFHGKPDLTAAKAAVQQLLNL